MDAQITFIANSDLKQKAMNKAKNEGITLKAVLTHSLKGYVEGKISFGMQTKEPDVEEFNINDKDILAKATRISNLLKN